MKIKPVIDSIVVLNMLAIAIISLLVVYDFYTYEDLRTAINWQNHPKTTAVSEHILAYWWMYIFLLNITLAIYFIIHAAINKSLRAISKFIWCSFLLLMPFIGFNIYWYFVTYRANDA